MELQELRRRRDSLERAIQYEVKRFMDGIDTPGVSVEVEAHAGDIRLFDGDTTTDVNIDVTVTIE